MRKLKSWPRSEYFRYDVAAVLLGAALLVFLLATAKYGVSAPDEGYYYTVAHRLSLGEKMIADEWNLAQLVHLLNLLPNLLYMKLTGGTEGLILFMRYLFIEINTVFYAYIYVKLRPYKGWGVAAAFLFARVPLIAAAVAGLGNGMFHVGGGIEVMNSSEKAGPLGLFVSPGAIGLFLGRFCAGFFKAAWFIPVGLLIAFGALILLPGVKRRFVSGNAEFSLETPPRGAIMLVLLFLVVALRSFMGTTPAFSAGEYLSPLPALWAGLIPVLALAFGKAAGGYLADAVGGRLTAILSLGVCAVLLFIPGAPVAKLAALFLFNMTMPLTLHAARLILKGAKGAAFGLLTAALFVGIIPMLLSFSAPSSGVLYGCLALVSLAMLVPCMGKERA